MAYSRTFSPKPPYAIALVLLTTTLLLACAPAAVSTSTPPPPAPRPAATSPAAAPKPAAEDETWSKVVAAARKEGVVTLYSTAFVADIGTRISRDFLNQFGIRVEILSGNGRSLMERIVLEQSMKRQIADVFNIGGAGSTSDLVLKGGADRIAHELPALRNKDAFRVNPVYSPGGEIVVWVVAYSTIVFNANLVKGQDEPRSYKDLLAPKWKGQILGPDPRTTGGSHFFYVPRFYKALDLEYYRGLARQEIKEFGGNPREAIRMLARGEYAFYVGGSADVVAPIMAEGAPLKMPDLAEGAMVNLGNILVVKGAPHPNAARVFVNWLMSPEGQRSYAEVAASTPSRKDVPDFLHPAARINPQKTLPRTWEFEEWAIKDQAAKTMEQVFGKK